MKLTNWMLLLGLLVIVGSPAFAQQYRRGTYIPRSAIPYQQRAMDASASAVQGAAPGQPIPGQPLRTKPQISKAATPSQTGSGYGGNAGGGLGYGDNGGTVLIPRVSMAGSGTSQGGASGVNGNNGGLQGSGGVSYVTTPTLRLRSQTIARQFFSAGGIRFAPTTVPNGY